MEELNESICIVFGFAGLVFRTLRTMEPLASTHSFCYLDIY